MATPKKKLCWNCEGRVSLEEENCPYCAVYLGPAPDEKGGNRDAFSPPYRLVESDDEVVPPSPYASETEPAPVAVEQKIELSGARTDLKEVVMPLVLLSAGSLLLIFGMVLWSFSENGVFTLSWDAEYWHYYLIIAVPMLFFGWRSLKRFDNDAELEEEEDENLSDVNS